MSLPGWINDAHVVYLGRNAVVGHEKKLLLINLVFFEK